MQLSLSLSLPRLAALASVLLLAAAFSCKTFVTPDETCDPSTLDAQRMHGEPAEGDCSRCLEDKCCDRVGVCTNKEGCADVVKRVHECVLSKGVKGAQEEEACAEANGLFGLAEANDTYRCMRDSCGSQCGLPVCRVDPASGLFQNAKCDECFAGSCCQEVNACYGSRACKLTLECIATCTDVFAGADGGPPTGPPTMTEESSELIEDRLCNDAGPVQAGDPPPCVRKCLCRFKDNDQGLKPLDAGSRPFSLAGLVYRCGDTANCRADCARGPDDAADADAATH